jgi:hypothetical protein
MLVLRLRHQQGHAETPYIRVRGCVAKGNRYNPVEEGSIVNEQSLGCALDRETRGKSQRTSTSE